MKTIKSLVLVAIFAISGVVNANTNLAKSIEPETVTEAIAELLKNPSFNVEQDVNATVLFTINKKNEMVVISVESTHKDVETFIKARLNYKKLSLSATTPSGMYKVPVKITSN
ncbi:MAG: hypothetical protein HKN99_03365 [Winogradskyella sp.]|nr:hypothetical protein [Winogradskyella sp.]